MLRQPGERYTDLFFDFPILGSTTISDAAQIQKVVSVLNFDLGPFVANMSMFEPRHGVTIFYGSTTRDYVICYACGDVQKHDNGRMTNYTIRDQRSRQTLT